MRVNDIDLQLLTVESQHDLELLRGARIFITGGTGYIGKWLLELLCYARSKLDLDYHLVILSRSPKSFIAAYPHLGDHEFISFVSGDVRDFSGVDGNFTHVIHAATDVIKVNSPLNTFDVTAWGTREVLEFAKERGVNDVLLLSSGAVYANFSKEVTCVSERYRGVFDVTSGAAAYGLGKFVSEWLCNSYGTAFNFRCKSARIFAQVGPHLELDAHFAVGNFIRDALLEKQIVIKGDGKSLRSYMYATDLIRWLIAILVRANHASSYNVGSQEAISIMELANRISSIVGNAVSGVSVLGQSAPGVAPDRYVPDISLARKDLGLEISVSLDDALRRTIEWYRLLFKSQRIVK